MGTVIRLGWPAAAALAAPEGEQQVEEGEGANASGYLWRERGHLSADVLYLDTTKEEPMTKTKIMKHDDPPFSLLGL